MKTKAAMCCVAMPVQPMSDSSQSGDFGNVRFAGNLGADGLYPAIVRSAEQAPLLHAGVALTSARPR
jgi:hypothetical protein